MIRFLITCLFTVAGGLIAATVMCLIAGTFVWWLFPLAFVEGIILGAVFFPLVKNDLPW